MTVIQHVRFHVTSFHVASLDDTSINSKLLNIWGPQDDALHDNANQGLLSSSSQKKLTTPANCIMKARPITALT
jgi:hypothetical protein